MKKRDIVVILLSIYFVISGVYGLKSWFFPSTLVSVASLIVVFFFFVIVLRCSHKNIPEVSKTKYGNIKKPIVLVGALIFCPLVFSLPIAVGTPAIVSLYFTPNSVITSKITSVETNNRHCDGEIKLEGFSAILIKRYICTDASEANKYKVGDVVELRVNKSVLGIRVFSMKKYG